MIKKIATCFLLNGMVFAQATSEEIKEVLSRNTYEPNYFSMILGLFVVVAMIYATGYLYQKLTKINMKPKDAFLNKAQIISTTSLFISSGSFIFFNKSLAYRADFSG